MPVKNDRIAVIAAARRELMAPSQALARSTNPGETPMPSSMPISRAARSGGTFPYPLSSTAAALIPAPYEMVPGCAPGGASAVVSFPQHGHSSDGSRYSVTHREIRTSQTCAHFEPAASAPARLVPHPEHSAGGSAAFRSPGSGSRERPVPRCPGCPPRLRSLRRSRSEVSRFFRSALRRSFAPIGSFELGVPELPLSIPRRRSNSAIRSSSRRSRSTADDSSARSTLTSVSFASTTARSRASSSRCSPPPPGRSGSSDTSRKLVQPELQLQARATACRAAWSPRNPLNGHLLCLVHRAAVHDEEDLSRNAGQQRLQELNEPRAIHPALMHLETQLSFR